MTAEPFPALLVLFALLLVLFDENQVQIMEKDVNTASYCIQLVN